MSNLFSISITIASYNFSFHARLTKLQPQPSTSTGTPADRPAVEAPAELLPAGSERADKQQLIRFLRSIGHTKPETLLARFSIERVHQACCVIAHDRTDGKQIKNPAAWITQALARNWRLPNVNA